MTGDNVCLMYSQSETYTVYHSKLACQVNLRSMMLLCAQIYQLPAYFTVTTGL